MFIDKDGTLIRNIPCSTDFRNIEFLTGAIDTLKVLQRSGYLLIIVTNQPGIALGLIAEEGLHRQYFQLSAMLRSDQVCLSSLYYCPHYPMGSGEYSTFCTCRKPAPGLLFKAAMDWRIDLRKSWMIGDILDDVEAGNRAGCKTILLDQGNETIWQKGRFRDPAHSCNNWAAIAPFIISSH